MNLLGDAFDKEHRREYLHSKLEPGVILYLFCRFIGDNGKNKYLLLLHFSDHALFFTINSNIPAWLENRNDLSEHQIMLSRDKYEFLQHDSYINCSNVIDCISPGEMYQQVYADMQRLKGKIADEDLFFVIEAVKNSKTISPKHKKEILDSFPGFE